MIFSNFKKKGKEMALTADEFKEIIKDGFGQRYEDTDEGESELRCFTCGAKAVLKESFFSDDIVCENDHKEDLKDFLVKHTAMRDGITDIALQKEKCNFESSK